MMKYTYVYFLIGFMFASMQYACKHEAEEVAKPTSNPPVGFDTTWSDVPTQVRVAGKTYFHNDVQKLMVTKCAVEGYINHEGQYACHSSNAGGDIERYIDHSEVFDIADLDGKTVDETKMFESFIDDKHPMPEVGVISQSEKDKLRSWINDGSPNNECNTCSDYNAGSFVSVAKILYDNCSGCHNDLSNQSGFSFFSADPNGTEDIDTTAVIGQSAAILASIVGNGVSRMPKYIPPLYECEFEVIEKWINDGMPTN